MTDSKTKDSGCLYVVATPIGHLEDMTYRAVNTLKSCDLILCEDTRHSKHLLNAYGIETTTRSLHAHNEYQATPALLAQIKAGQNMALISDAGTPLVSDPGFPLIEQAHQQGIRVIPVPGASAVIALLSVAGLPVQPFTFHGFIPPKTNQRKTFYQQLLPLNQTHVFYESSHRIVPSLTDLVAVLGAGVPLRIGREMTKQFEHIYIGSAEAVKANIESSQNHQKGEFVVAIGGLEKTPVHQMDEASRRLARQLKSLLPPKQAAAVVAEHYDLNKKTVYGYITGL